MPVIRADLAPLAASALFADGTDWGTVALLAGAGLLALIAVLALTWPYGLLRLWTAIRARTTYWLRVRGRENVPATGGALLVCNQLHSLDCLFLLVAHRRRIRPIVLGGWASRPWPRRLLRWAGAFVLDGTATHPDVERVFGEAAEAIERGELVCLFAEHFRTRDGEALTFSTAYELIASRARVPVVPVCLDQPWGSRFRMETDRIERRWSAELPYPIWVKFGTPLPAGTLAAEVRQAVQLLSADLARETVAHRRPVHRQFVRVAGKRPFSPCFFDSSNPTGNLTYAKALAGAMCLAKKLRPILGDNPMVGVWLPSSTGGAIANIALALLGKTTVNLNYTSSMEGNQSCLTQCGVRHVLTAHRFMARMKLDPGPNVALVHLEDVRQNVTKLEQLRAFLAVLLLPTWVLDRWVLGLGRHRPDDLATVIFSSGSTGAPKGVMLTHANIAANVESVLQEARVDHHDRLLGTLPLFHSFGYTVTLWTPLQIGASVVYHADPRQAKEIGELTRKHGGTVYVSTATFLRFCLKKCDPDDFKSLRLLICGAEKLPQPLAQDFHKKFGVLPLEGYGCTEVAPVASVNLPDYAFDGMTEIGNRPGTIGQPLAGVAIRVAHPDTLEPVPTGEEGVLLIRGGNVMKGYLGRPDLTEKAIVDGWYVTGDMGRQDADGFVTITGRLSRFAKVGGEMVPLERVEEELHEILGTSDRVCGVTCVPDEARGERLVVLYVEEQLTCCGVDRRAWWQQLNGRGLPNLWVPSERDFYAIAELAVLGSGKLDLKRLKEMAVEMARK